MEMHSLLEPVGKVEPNLILWVTGIALVVVGVGSTRKLRSYWRGGETFQRARTVFEFFGEPMATAMASAVPLAGPASVLFGVIGLVLLTREVTTGAVQQIMDVVGNILVLPTMVALLLGFTIVLFGRPKFLIPPHLRKHRGFLGELIASVVASVASRRTDRR